MDYSKLKMDQLREQCRINKLSTEGKKDDLLKRLLASDIKKTNPLAFTDIVETDNSIENNKQQKSATLFINVKASNLPFYFNAGVIYPLALEESVIYRNENRKKDVFSQFEEYIILSEKSLNKFEDDDVLVEIIINGLKVDKIDNEQLMFSGDPIPLSRIKSIVFPTTVSKNTFISSVKTFPDSFIPESLCYVTSNNMDSVQIDLNSISLPQNNQISEWKIRLKKFDRLMGMFSFMKNAGIFFAERDNSYQEYTTTYFSALSLINSQIKTISTKDLGLYRYILFPFDIEQTNVQRVLFRQILDTIHNDIDFDLDIAQKIIEKSLASNLASEEEAKELRQILEYFNKLNQHQVAYKDLLFVDIIRKNYPILSLLYLAKFSNKSRQHTDKQAVRNSFIFHEAQFSKSLTEYLLGILGLYYGYKTMIREDTNLKLIDNVFSMLAEKQQSIKFKLTSTLDRVIIESIFNFCRTDKTLSEDYPFLKVDQENSRQPVDFPTWGAFDYQSNEIFVCQTRITMVDRKNKSNRIIELVEKEYSGNVNGNSLLVHYLLSNYGISKEIIIELMKLHVNKLNVEEMIQLIKIDQTRKNNR